VEAVHPRDERLDRRLSLEWAPLPWRAEVAPANELPACSSQPVDRSPSNERRRNARRSPSGPASSFSASQASNARR